MADIPKELPSVEPYIVPVEATWEPVKPSPGFFSRDQHYYATYERKVGDFFAGMGVSLVLFFAYLILLPYYFPLFIDQYIQDFYFFGVLLLLAWVVLLVYSFVLRRHWLGIGAIVSIPVFIVLIIIIMFSLISLGLLHFPDI